MEARAISALLARALRDAARHRLLLTAMPALNGTVATLASQGALREPAVLAALALAGIAGPGAFAVASLDFGSRGRAPGARALLAAIALLSTALVALAAALGSALGAADARWLRLFGGAALLVVALQVAGLRVPEPRGVPLPLALALAGLAAEAAL